MYAVGNKLAVEEPIPEGKVICSVCWPKIGSSYVISTSKLGSFSPKAVATICELGPCTNCTLLYKSVFIKKDLRSFLTVAALAIIDISKPPNGLASAVLNQLAFILYISPFVPGAK